MQHSHIHLVFYQCLKNTSEKSVFEFKFHKNQIKILSNTTPLLYKFLRQQKYKIRRLNVNYISK